MEKIEDLTDEEIEKLNNDKINRLIMTQVFREKIDCLNYSRDIKHALELMSKLNYRWQINTGDDICNNTRKAKYEVSAVMYLGMGDFVERKVKDDSLPRAICLASLKMRNIF